MSLNASGVRDTARVLRISTDTVLRALRKKEAALVSVNTALLRTVDPTAILVDIRHYRELFSAPGVLIPSPLMGEGQGGGERQHRRKPDSSPPSQPSPARGEGVKPSGNDMENLYSNTKD